MTIRTPSQTVGPFFHDALRYEAGHELVPEGCEGSFVLSGRVLDGNADPVPDALVEIWQAGPDGAFSRAPGILQVAESFRGFGRSDTDADGRYWFRTVKPGPVPTVDERPQAPHIAMSVFARGMLRRVVTRVYVPDEAEANGADPLLSELGEPRRATLVALPRDDGDLVFDVRLQGDQETVFLDVF